jgi:class 3 adenylate cyclase
MNPLPTGTVTFLFTDIQGSARMAQDCPVDVAALFARHNAILNDAITRHNGAIFQIVGDAFCAAIATASDGFTAALDAQHCLQGEPWQPAKVGVRMGLHIGEAWVTVRSVACTGKLV